MHSKCKEYASLEASLSPTGKKWSSYVRSCLQKVLATNVLIPAPAGKVECTAATNAFFDDHINCYLNGSTSFCSLPYSDMGYIVMHGASILFSKHWYEPLESGIQLKFACDVDFWETQLSHMSSLFHSLSSAISCTTTSLIDSINLALGSKNWTVVSVSANTSWNSVADVSILVLASVDNAKFPVNYTIANEMASDAMAKWLRSNTQCLLSFNGANIFASAEI